MAPADRQPDPVPRERLCTWCGHPHDWLWCDVCGCTATNHPGIQD